ncbi:DedA family protein [Cytobacillus purgationiresistens]|uniref:Membrane-associated protein n=1 Tax=Cytobacillus purgationiresistens TaxID=863449 RepID=A0ABU0ARJ2_9BACI|nr:VTT domain-containing protein [Cytobacillus purgationiresistens]MDQ0273412.1 membrane-associated protein [Cytobacillus purgationiresistens]
MFDIIQFISEFDDHLSDFLYSYGLLIYVLLFLFIYLKTAFVVLTFIPGDSIVFASGALAAMGKLQLAFLIFLFFFATVMGDSQNFSIGTLVKRINRQKHHVTWLSDTQVHNAQSFVEQNGHLSIIMARFIPLMRTTVPFVSGIMKYPYLSFLKYNSFGAVIWVFFWLSMGLVLGNIHWVEDHLLLSLTIISFLPLLIPLLYCVLKKYG